MNRFAPYPFLRITPFFILGIVVCHYFTHDLKLSIYPLLALVIAYVALSLIDSLRFKTAIGFVALTCLVLLGHYRLRDFKEDNKPDHLLYFTGEIEAYEAVIIEEPEVKKKSIKVLLRLTRVYSNNSWEDGSARINVYLNDSLASSLKYGDILLVKGRPDLMKRPANPGEFDYASYLVYNNIFHQHFAGEEFQVVGHHPPSAIINHSLKLRDWCRRLLSNHIENPQIRSVVLALVIGMKDELAEELKSAYSAAGAMHVLAVSGLHVGIIYGLVLLIFKRTGLRSRKTKWLLAIVSLLILWLYAFVTGLSPSVLRAVTMFSFIAIGKAMQRNTNIYNTLAASAFVLLWYNPYLIMSVGFQLSYLAVFGIVYLQPKFYGLVNVEHPILEKIWTITCVSLAAQIATAPLSILYFHQFPSYFFISNLFIIPAALIILTMGLALLILGWVPGVGVGVSWILSKFVYLTNVLVFSVEALPGSLIEGLQVKTYESWLIYITILGCLLFLARKRFKLLIFSTIMMTSFALSQIVDRSKYSRSSSLSIFDLSGASVLDFNVGAESKLMGDQAFLSEPDKVRFSIQPKRLISYQSTNVDADHLNLVHHKYPGMELIVFQNQTIVYALNDSIRQIDAPEPLPIDYLILSNNAVDDLSTATRLFEFENLIIDKSNRKYLADRLTIQAERLNLNPHSVYESGYLELNFCQ